MRNQKKVHVNKTCDINPKIYYYVLGGFPDGSVGKESVCNARDVGDAGLILRSGRSPEIGNGNPLQCSCLENSMDRGAWWVRVHGVAKSRTRLSTHAHKYTHSFHR